MRGVLFTELIKLARLHISNRLAHAIFMVASDPVPVNIKLVGAVAPSLHCVTAPLQKHRHHISLVCKIIAKSIA